MTPKLIPATPKPLPDVYPNIEPGDHVYFHHPERGPLSARVLATGQHGLTATCPLGDLYRIHWQRILGVKERMQRRVTLVENGAEGCIVEDDQGVRRYIAHAGKEEVEEGEERNPKPARKARSPDHRREGRTTQKSLAWFQYRGLQLPKEGTAQGSIASKTIVTEADVIKTQSARLKKFAPEAGCFLFFKARPTPAQIEAGNYPKHHVQFQGLRISIENPKGSVRSGVGPHGKPWRTVMRCPYGYIRGSKGVDKDHVDCYLGPHENADFAYIVHQRQAGNWDQWDEDKVMLGFKTQADATRAYLAHYDDPRFLGPVTSMPMVEFKHKVLATAHRPKMIKGRILFFKAEQHALFDTPITVQGHTRASGKYVAPFASRRKKRLDLPKTADLFEAGQHPARTVAAATARTPINPPVINNEPNALSPLPLNANRSFPKRGGFARYARYQVVQTIETEAGHGGQRELWDIVRLTNRASNTGRAKVTYQLYPHTGDQSYLDNAPTRESVLRHLPTNLRVIRQSAMAEPSGEGSSGEKNGGAGGGSGGGNNGGNRGGKGGEPPTNFKFLSSEVSADKADAHQYRLATQALVQPRYANHPPTSVTVQTTQETILVSWSGIKHVLRDGKPTWQESLATLHVEELLESAVKIAIEPDRLGRKDPIAIHRYQTTAQFDGVTCRVILVVREHTDGKRYYDHSVVETKNPAGLPASPTQFAAPTEPTPPSTGLDHSIPPPALADKAPASAKQPATATPSQPPLKNYGWDAVKLANAYSIEELNTLMEQVKTQHANPKIEGKYVENSRPTIFLYDRKGRKKLESLSWAIYYKLKEPTHKAWPFPAHVRFLFFKATA